MNRLLDAFLDWCERIYDRIAAFFDGQDSK